MNALEELICWHKYLYYKRAEPTLTDYEYDMLESKLKAEFPDSPILSEARYIECPHDLWPEYNRQWAAGRRNTPI